MYLHWEPDSEVHSTRGISDLQDCIDQDGSVCLQLRFECFWPQHWCIYAIDSSSSIWYSVQAIDASSWSGSLDSGFLAIQSW